jgi:hypothetical protein
VAIAVVEDAGGVAQDGFGRRARGEVWEYLLE